MRFGARCVLRGLSEISIFEMKGDNSYRNIPNLTTSDSEGQERAPKRDAEMTLCMWSECHDVKMLLCYHAGAGVPRNVPWSVSRPPKAIKIRLSRYVESNSDTHSLLLSHSYSLIPWPLNSHLCRCPLQLTRPSSPTLDVKLRVFTQALLLLSNL